MKKKFIPIFIGVALMVFSSITVFATAGNPFGGYGVYIAADGSSATAFTNRCSCLPVNNYLAAWIRVQYNDGGQYINDPINSNHYYYDSGYNVESVSKTLYHPNIVYAKSVHRARCGSGSIQEITRTASR